MATNFSPSHAELALVAQIFLQADPQKIGIITGDVAVRVFGGAKLPPTVLGEIWSIADEENNGWLSKKGVAIAVRLMGWAQMGEKMTQSLVNKPGPLPSIEGVATVAQHNTGMSLPKSPPPGLPKLTAQDKTKFQRLFAGCGPVHGLLSGDKARDVFVKSKLPVEKLLQIWNLADTQDRGALDSTDFAIGMYLIQASMSGQLSFIPTSLPPGLYEQAGGNPTATIPSHATGTSGSFSPTLTGAFPQTRSALQQQYTGQSHSLQPNYTGASSKPATSPRQPTRPSVTFASSAFGGSQGNGLAQQWDVTTAEKASADRYFDGLDPQKKGYIEGDVAVPFMLESKLPGDDLAQVWDLADINHDGRLTRDGFAVAMHLIQGKLGGQDIPTVLPASLIPPSMRSNGARPFLPPAQQEQHDLLGDDTPPQSATLPQQTGNVLQQQMTGALQQQTAFVASSPPRPQLSHNYGPFGSSPQRNLLDNDDGPGSPSVPLHDQSAEIGNVQNQLNSTNRSLETTKLERASVEQTLANQAGQLSALQTQLSSAKAAYETETRLLSTLRERLSAQTVDMQRTKEDLIRAESELSAVRVEKAEVEGSFLRDKEDARELHRKMIEAGQQAETIKLEVEKARKEAKQQKGLLAIARKQLSTKETERTKYEKDLEDAEAEAAEATKEREEAEAELAKFTSFSPNIIERTGSTGGDSLNFAASHALPATPDVYVPAALSPNITGKSNNPFERIAKSGNSTPRSISPFLTANSRLPPPPTVDVPLTAPSDDPFGFAEPFTAEVPAAPQQDPLASFPDVETATLEVPTDKLVPPLSVSPVPPAPGSPTANGESDHFMTPPDTATDPSRVTSPILKIPDHNGSSILTELDGPLSPPESTLPGHFPLSPDYHQRNDETDLKSQPMELDINESDSDSDDDEVPLSELKAKVYEDNAAPATNGKSVISALDAPPTIPFDDTFGPLMDTSAFTAFTASPVSVESDSPFTKQSRDALGVPVTQASTTPFPTSTQELDVHAAGVNAFDEAMGKIPSGSSTAVPQQLSFETAFDDNFVFPSAKFPPAPPTNLNGDTPVALSVVKQTNGFDSIFTSPPSKETPTTLGDSQGPSSFDEAFASTPSAAAPKVPVDPSTQNNHGISFDEAFSGLELSQTLKHDSPFGSLPSRTSPRPANSHSRPFSTVSPPASPRSASSPVRMSAIGPSLPPRQWSPPPRVASPKPRPSTSSSGKETLSQERPKDPPPRHSKLSIRLPFGRKKRQDHLPPPPPPAQLLAPIEEPSRTITPAVDDDVETVKQLCGMGFSRTQAVTALEAHGYDFQRALNSLLTANDS